MYKIICVVCMFYISFKSSYGAATNLVQRLAVVCIAGAFVLAATSWVVVFRDVIRGLVTLV